MEINLKKLGQQAIETTDVNETKMRLSEDASSMVFQLFTKNVYSNPIGTVVREITSNCFDSHVEAQSNDPKWKEAPVVIRKHKDENSGQHYISFIDYGVGMSPERVQNVYGVYFESTKRVDNTQIGGFGIGGKTPLAYKRSTGAGEGEYDNSFYVITTFGGTKYYYVISEGEECPVIHKLHEESTDDRNGTEIRIPVLEKDIDKFETEIRRQLYYFENIVFEGFYEKRYDGTIIEDEQGKPKPSISNDYQIIRGKTFLFRGETYSDYMHVCLGRVAYPIDYSTLDLHSSDYHLPIALKLEVGDVNVTVSREQLDYSEKTIKFLKAKLEETKKEIHELVAKQYDNVQTLEDYFKVKTDFGKLEFPNGMILNVGDVIKQSDVSFDGFRYQFMKMPSDKQLFRFFFNYKIMGKKPSRSRWSNDKSFEGGYKEILENKGLYHTEDWKRKILKQAWLKQEHTTWYLIQKNDIVRESLRGDIADLFKTSLDSVFTDKGNPVAFMKELLKMQNEFWKIIVKNTESYDTLEVPEDFKESRRNNGMTEEMRMKTIPVNFTGGNSRVRVMVGDLLKYKMPIFYGTTDDEYLLNKSYALFNLLFHKNCTVSNYYGDEFNTRANRRRYYVSNNAEKNLKSIMFIRISKANVKYMEHCRNAKHVSKFFSTMLKRKEDVVLQSFECRELINNFNNIDRFYTDGRLGVVSPEWQEKVDVVKQYIDRVSKEISDSDIQYYKSELKPYFNIDDIKPSAELQEMEAVVAELREVEQRNQDVMNCFNMPYYIDRLRENEKLVTILQVSLEL